MSRCSEHVGRWAASTLLLLACGAPVASDDERALPADRASSVAATHPLAGLPAAYVFTFALDHVRLSIEDLEGRSLDALRIERGASLVLNAGFFDPAFTPEGLSVSEGRELSPLLPSLSGGVLTIDDDRGQLFEAETYEAPSGSPIDFAVQCRPRLVVDERNNIASDNGVRAARTALCIRDGHRTLDVVIAPAPPELGVTLYELAEALVTHGCSDALNLDGGPSTGAAWRDIADGGRHLPPRGPVRQVILIRSAP